MRHPLPQSLLALVMGAAMWLVAAIDPAQARMSDDSGSPAGVMGDPAAWNVRKTFVVLENGRKLALVEGGDPAGEPLLLLHGYTDSSRVWHRMEAVLGEYRLIMPDQRGHGASEAPSCCYAVADFADDARQLLDALGVERAMVAGHSLGSFVAQDLAARHPERISAVALLASTGLAPIGNGHPLYETVLGFQDGVDPAFLGEWVPQDLDPAFRRAALHEAGSIPVFVWRSVLAELVDYPVARHARFVAAPVLIVSASDDELFDGAHHLALIRAYPEADAVVLTGLTHNFPIEHPQTTALLLREWFATATTPN